VIILKAVMALLFIITFAYVVISLLGLKEIGEWRYSTPWEDRKYPTDHEYPKLEPSFCVSYGDEDSPEIPGIHTVDNETFEDKCLDNNKLLEYYCLEDEIKSKTYDCQYYCKEKHGENYVGVCISDKEGVGFCNCTLSAPPGEIPTETDGGDAPEIPGMCIIGDESFVDTCTNTIDLIEYYCSENKIKSKNYDCDSYCKGKYGENYVGVCVSDKDDKGFCNCTISIPPIEIFTEKNPSMYTCKQAFLISDEDWRNVLSLVPIAVWTSEEDSKWCQKGYGIAENVCAYPVLIYHKEDKGFDADSIIYFFQQYAPKKVIVVGDAPQELLDLLVAEPELGAGLEESQITKISANFDDHLKYWESFEDIVIADYDDYSAGLMASVYASLINAPLFLVNKDNIESRYVKDKNVIVVGSVDKEVMEAIDTYAKSKKVYSLEGLQKEYVKLTGTNKIILVNPDDLEISASSYLWPEKSSEPVRELYTKTSLAAPILAAAKHEVIIMNNSTDYLEIDQFIEERVKDFGNIEFLTIIGAPNAIPHRVSAGMYCRALDPTQYADLNDDFKPDLYVGRIQSITLSDVSSYLARDLFFHELEKTDNVIFLAGEDSDVYNNKCWAKKFKEVGYNATYLVSDWSFSEEDWRNKHLIYYDDHGSDAWAGILSTDIPLLSNSIVLAEACLTCSTYDARSFCNRAIRRGAIAYFGAVDIASGTYLYIDIANYIYYYNLSLGKAFTSAYRSYNEVDKYLWFVTFLGDPTLHIRPKYLLAETLEPWYLYYSEIPEDKSLICEE